ncbi:MAG TPA: hypothetical protein VFI38_08140 [Candidatus Acidoferrum sp.]|nr:hypothetical protein [Candidatus Acidoferrum sp.]
MDSWFFREAPDSESTDRSVWHKKPLSVFLLYCFIGLLVYWNWPPMSAPPGDAVAALAVAAAVMAVLGEMKGKEKVAWISLLFGFLSLELTSINTERKANEELRAFTRQQEQKQFATTMDSMNSLLTTIQITEKNTEREAYVVWPPAIQVTSWDPLRLGIPFSNSGGEAAKNIVNDGKVFLGATNNTDEEAKRLKKEFERWWRHPEHKHWNMKIYAPGSTQGFFSLDELVLSPEDKQRILKGELTYYVFVRIIYSDHSGRWAFDACSWVQQAGRDLSITHPCSVNNNPKYAVKRD